jgi:hypothetical protein
MKNHEWRMIVARFYFAILNSPFAIPRRSRMFCRRIALFIVSAGTIHVDSETGAASGRIVIDATSAKTGNSLVGNFSRLPGVQ